MLRRFILLAVAVCCGGSLQAHPVINEFSPRPAAEEGEWIELHNPDSTAVLLRGWSIADATGRVRVIEDDVAVPGGGWILLASRPDSLRAHFRLSPGTRVIRPDGWPTLNDNDASGGGPADRILLADPSGAGVDSVAYFNAWLPVERGRSLERVSPASPGMDAASWGWSLNRATPGGRNSLAPDAGEAGQSETWSGPDRVEPGRVPAVFSYRFSEPGRLAVFLIDEDGHEVAALREPGAVAPAGLWVWGATAPTVSRSGLYFLCVRWLGETRSVRECKPVWVNR